jgi:hypothetical protein
VVYVDSWEMAFDEKKQEAEAVLPIPFFVVFLHCN